MDRTPNNCAECGGPLDDGALCAACQNETGPYDAGYDEGYATAETNVRPVERIADALASLASAAHKLAEIAERWQRMNEGQRPIYGPRGTAIYGAAVPEEPEP